MVTAQEEINRAEHAFRLLNDELLKAALASIKSEVVQAWIDCPQRDEKGKEALWQLMKTAEKFEGMLTGYVETGKLSTKNLKHFEETEEKVSMAKRLLRAL